MNFSMMLEIKQLLGGGGGGGGACGLCDETVKTWTSKAKDWHVSKLVKASCRPHASICSPYLSSPLHTFLPSDLRGGGRWGEGAGVEGEGWYLYFPPGRVLPAHHPDRLSKAPADRLVSTWSLPGPPRLQKHPIPHRHGNVLASPKSSWQRGALKMPRQLWWGGSLALNKFPVSAPIMT